MEKILNITNGDSTVFIMKEAKLQGDFLPWRDILHEGAVLKNLSFEMLCELRAKFIASKGWGDLELIQNDFKHKIKTIQNIQEYEKIILWFEHDLYDQLQLLQILDLLFDKQIKVSLICTNNYLGLLSVKELLELKSFEREVTKEQFYLAKKAWSAFKESTPLKWQELLDEDLSPLEFLEPCVKRVLQEYPSCQNGLSLTLQNTLQILKDTQKQNNELFKLYQKSEQSMFMGDMIYWDILNCVTNTDKPLLKLEDNIYSLTPLGLDVINLKINYLDICDIDKYIGGVNLTNNNLWCYDKDKCKIKRYK